MGLVILDENYEVINGNARGAVSSDEEGVKFPWIPPALADLADGPDGLNEESCLIALLEGCDDDEAKEGGEDPILFFFTTGADGITSQIRKLTGVKPKGSEPQLLMLDIPDDGGFHVADLGKAGFTADSVNTFLQDFKAKKTTRQQLKK